MKIKHIFLLPLLFISLSVFSQVQVTERISLEPQKIISDHKNESDDGIITLKGNVVLETDKLTIGRADKVIWNKKNNHVTAYGLKSFSFIGHTTISGNRKGKMELQYYLGADTIHIQLR